MKLFIRQWMTVYKALNIYAALPNTSKSEQQRALRICAKMQEEIPNISELVNEIK